MGLLDERKTAFHFPVGASVCTASTETGSYHLENLSRESRLASRACQSALGGLTVASPQTLAGNNLDSMEELKGDTKATDSSEIVGIT